MFYQHFVASFTDWFFVRLLALTGALLLLAQYYSARNVPHKKPQTKPLSAYQNAKPMSEIPSPPKQMIIGHLGLIAQNAKSLHIFHDELRKKYGNIVLLSIPGCDMVYVYDPELTRTLFSKEGKSPHSPPLEMIEWYR